MPDGPAQVIHGWISKRAQAPALDWYRARREALRENFSDREFAIAFGMIPRKLGRADLALSAAEQEAALAARPGWVPLGWSIDQAARIALLLEFGAATGNFAQRFPQMVHEADVGEAIALLRGLPLYPGPEALIPVAAEALRSNMRSVFEAVAHHSPFPSEHFDEGQWNQMVLKAVFIGSPLAPIQRLDARANGELAISLIHTARERRAAGRPIGFELWRCVGPFAREDMIADIACEMRHGDRLGRRAAALALAAAPDGLGLPALGEAPDLAAEIASGRLTWAELAGHAGPGLQQHFERAGKTGGAGGG